MIIDYHSSDCAFIGLKKLFKTMKISVNDVIIVTFIDRLNIKINFYKRNGLELKLTKNSENIIQEDLQRSKRRKTDDYHATDDEDIFYVMNIKEEEEGYCAQYINSCLT